MKPHSDADHPPVVHHIGQQALLFELGDQIADPSLPEGEDRLRINANILSEDVLLLKRVSLFRGIVQLATSSLIHHFCNVLRNSDPPITSYLDRDRFFAALAEHCGLKLSPAALAATFGDRLNELSAASHCPNCSTGLRSERHGEDTSDSLRRDALTYLNWFESGGNDGGAEAGVCGTATRTPEGAADTDAKATEGRCGLGGEEHSQDSPGQEHEGGESGTG